MRNRREVLGLTFTEAARVGGLARETWSRFENNKQVPSRTSATKIARALRWPPDALERIEAGEDPADLPTIDDAPTDDDDPNSPDALVALWKELPPEQRDRLKRYAAALWVGDA